MAYIRPLWRSAASQLRLSFARPMMQFLVLLNPLLSITTYYFLFRQGAVTGAGEYVLVGSSLILLWGTILWSSATDIDRERWMGTFELLLIAPVPFPVTIFGKILGNMVLGVLTLLINVACGMLLFGLRVDVAEPGRLALTLAVALASFSGFSLMLALLFTLARGANSIANGLAYPIYLFSGLLFPLTLLPGWARAAGLVMPLGWAREAARWALLGETGAAELWTSSFWAALGGLGGVGLAYFMLSLVLFRLIFERKIRQLGQLGVA